MVEYGIFDLPPDQAEFVAICIAEQIELITNHPDIWEEARQRVIEQREEADQRLLDQGRVIILPTKNLALARLLVNLSFK